MPQLENLNQHQFRLPTNELNRISLRLAIMFLIAAIILHLFRSGGIGFIAPLVVLGVLVACYFYGKQHVWITLSTEGMVGRGSTNRELTINWNEPITITLTSVSGVDGYDIRASENDGFVKKKVLSFFVPRAIIETTEFAQVLAKFSPSSHALRSIANLAKKDSP